MARIDRRWKPKPKRRVVRVWACGVCGKEFRNMRDPNLAACCTCFRCGGAIPERGVSRICQVCDLRAAIAFNEKTAASVERTIMEMCNALAKAEKAANLRRKGARSQ